MSNTEACVVVAVTMIGISPEILNIAEPSDLINISSLHIALGRAFNGASRNAESALSFHDALRVSRQYFISYCSDVACSL